MKVINVRDIMIGEGMPKVIVPLVEKTESKLIDECVRIMEFNPDIIEWRVDSLSTVEDLYSVQRLLELIRGEIGDIPLLFTFRTIEEGGNKKVSLPYYKELLNTAIQSRLVDLVDIELNMDEETVNELVASAKEFGVYVVMSNHDFQQTPMKEEIIRRLCKMQDLGADIPKIAVMSTNTKDVVTLLDASQELRSKYLECPFIAISMGKMGIISRLAGEIFGSAATFASVVNQSAPGQIPISEVRNILHLINHYSK
ncbi:type I 3-dehydroquinate dehydratase [Ornithinibacillus halotolerans]|uniref:3-dehydroquinate dehydratase n=1 Tax=Ornithinibacillus halotolerans TaxID=1274357 RepID=A0A916RYI5_9BACI|nr:type I 3-dehydroquinate dehydratase [Ornithinibacillus halotolerans]GGA77141.1 3-dehydroquinate dehydratase [Ornithinibacillus halotolerans]